MSEHPRPDDAPQGTPPAQQASAQQTSAQQTSAQQTSAQQANAARRRFLIKALQVGSAVPVIMTISRPAFATGSATAGSPLHS